MQINLRLAVAFSYLLMFSAGARDTIEPLPFHELEATAGTVAVPWAHPAASGPIRAVAIAPYSTLGDIARLRGHIELDLETAAVWDREHLGFDPRFPEPTFPDASYEAVESRIARLLGNKKTEVIILGQCDPAMFPVAIQEQIIARVEAGCGLLVARAGAYSGGDGPIATWLRDADAFDEPPGIARGVGPLGFADLAAALLATCRKAGEGRIVLLDMQRMPAPNHCLVPIPEDPFALLPEHEANALSLACKAIQWLAGQSPPDTISHISDVAPQGPADEEIPAGYPREFVEAVQQNAFSGPLRPFVLHLDGPASASYDVTYQLRVPGTTLAMLVQEENAVLPKGARTYSFDIIATPGDYLLDIWLKNRKGIVTWHTEAITVSGWPRIADLSITQDGKDAVWLHPNDHLDVTVEIASGELLTARYEATVYARAVDSFGRQVANTFRAAGPEGGSVSLRLDLADLIAPLLRVEVFAVPSGQIDEAMLVNQSAREVYYFPVRLPDPFLEPALVLSAAGPFDYESLRQLEFLRREFGTGALHAPPGSHSLLASGKTGLNRIAQVGLFDRGAVGPGESRVPCLSSTSFRERESKKIESGVLGAWAGGPPFYSLGANFTLTGTEANVCQSAECLAHFHAYLQDTYASLEALNGAWGTDYQQWADARPRALDLCQQDGNWAPWLDFRLSMDAVVARAPQLSRTAVHAIDPSGRVGFQSPATMPGALAGYDWRQLCAAVDFITSPAGGPAQRRLQSYHRGQPYSGIVLGGEQMDSDPRWIQWAAWNSLLGQLPAIWLEEAIGAGPAGLLTPSGAPKPGLAALGASLGPIQEGVGTLLLNAVPHPSGVAFVDSPASAYVDFADPEPGRTAGLAEQWLDNALNEMGFSAGVRSLSDPLDGINTLILSRTRVLSDEEVAALKSFHNKNGLILADGRPGTLDRHGIPRDSTPLPFLHPLDPEHPTEAFALWTNRPVWVSQMAGVTENKEVLAEMLVRAGNTPAAPVKVPEKQSGALTRFQFQYGAATLVACLASPDAPTTTRRARMELPDKHHGVDLLQSSEIQPRGHMQWSITPGQPALFSILPYAVEEVIAHAPELAFSGQRLPLDIVLDTDGTEPGTHLLLIRLYDPSGAELRHYRRCLAVERGAATTYLPLAENETPGFYTLSVRDILTRTDVALRVEIQ